MADDKDEFDLEIDGATLIGFGDEVDEDFLNVVPPDNAHGYQNGGQECERNYEDGETGPGHSHQSFNNDEEQNQFISLYPSRDQCDPDDPANMALVPVQQDPSSSTCTPALAALHTADNANDDFDDGMDAIFSQIEIEDPRPHINKSTHVASALALINSPLPNNINKTYGKLLPVSYKSPIKRSRPEDVPSFFLSQSEGEVTDADLTAKRSCPGPAGSLSNLTRVVKPGVPIPILSSLEATKIHHSNNINPSSKIKQIHPRMKPGIGNERKKNTSIIDSEDPLVQQQGNRPWQSVMSELNLRIRDPDSIVHSINIDWVKSNINRFPDKVKIPLLIVVVKHDLTEQLVARNTTILTDHSGSIFGFLDDTFLDAYKNLVLPGTCLALKNCRIQVQKERNRICLVVLKRSVLCLCTPKEITEPAPVCSDDPVGPIAFPRTKICKNKTYLLQTAPWMPERILSDYHGVLRSIEQQRALDQENQANNKPKISNNNNNVALYAPLARKDVNHVSSFPNGCNKSNQQPTAGKAVISSLDNQAGFDDDDDEEFMLAIQGIDFDMFDNT